jgi:hypothetical protein
MVLMEERITLSKQYYLKAIEKGAIETFNNYANVLEKGIYGKGKIPLSKQHYL